MKVGAKKKSKELAASAAIDCRKQLHAYLRRRLNRPQDVDDLAQEVYLRLLRIKDENKVSSVRERMAYVYTVAAKVVSRYWSDMDVDTARYSTSECRELSDLNGDDPMETAARQQHLERVLTRLPPIQRAALLMLKRDGLTYEEIAAELHISVHMVHHHVTQAKAKIRLTPWRQ
jgi:RNA polymerase sigma factor (sigma-70 family)